MTNLNKYDILKSEFIDPRAKAGENLWTERDSNEAITMTKKFPVN